MLYRTGKYRTTAYYIPEDLNLYLKIIMVVNTVLGIMTQFLCAMSV
jgi:hypothetical protein